MRPPALKPRGDAIPISIHAPTWGATVIGVELISIAQFQSTHPRGVRPASEGNFGTPLLISIHAPTWGATDGNRGSPNSDIFQSTHPRGVRPFIWSFLRNWTLFQSTHPRGVRLQNSPENADALKFQSTHPRGVRRDQLVCHSGIVDFNPRTHVGCDIVLGKTIKVFSNFNPRTHVGCDTAEAQKARQWQISIHAPTWGATYI